MKKRMIILAVMCALLLLVALLAFVRVRPRTIDKIRTTQTLKAVTEYNALGYIEGEGYMRGFDYEMLKTFSDSMGWQLEVTPEDDMSKNIEGINNGTYDVIMNLLPTTLDLKEKLLLSEPIMKNYLVLIQRIPIPDEKYKRIRTVDDLEGQTIYLPLNSPDILVLNNLKDETGVNFRIEHIANIGAEQLLTMVARGEIDYSVADVFMARSVKKFYPNLDVTMRIGFAQPRAYAFAQGNAELKRLFDEWLATFKETKEFGELYRKYYN